jgi:hypothetical protein
MANRLFEKFRQAFEPKVTLPRTAKPEFEPEHTRYQMPEPELYDLYYLDPLSKRKVTICNLFANHQKAIPEIGSLLEVSRKLVIDTLIENKLLKDRRKTPRPSSPTPEELGIK